MLSHSIVATGRAALAGLVLSAGLAAAQQPSAEALATAKELITVKGGTAIYEPVIPGVVEQAKSVFLRTNPMLSKDLNEVAAKLRADLAPRAGEMVNEAARLYATRFNEKELKDALAFYKSPLGRKLVVVPNGTPPDHSFPKSVNPATPIPANRPIPPTENRSSSRIARRRPPASSDPR